MGIVTFASAMSRKHWSILLCSLAYSVLLLHSVVPHHHHEDDLHAQTGNATVYPSDEDDADQGLDHSLSHAFAHFQHDPGVQVTYLHFDQHLDQLDLQPVAKVFLASFYTFVLTQLEERQPPPPRPPDKVLATAQFTTPNILRGPPIHIA